MFRRARLSLPREAQARPGLAVPRRAHALQLVAQLVGGRGQLRGRPRTLAVLEEQWRRTEYRGDDDLVFGHPPKGTPVDTSKLAKRYLKPALARAGIEKPFRPFHDLRHTSLTHAAAAGNPQIYVQARAGHSQGSITERYMHAAQVLFPGAAEKSEARMFGDVIHTNDHD